jgi:hypothetical protein
MEKGRGKVVTLPHPGTPPAGGQFDKNRAFSLRFRAL